ncbi:MAG TPA: hypothetical protein VGD53_03900 [Actinoallomurus sp.]|jgi:hypothetical protein
MADDGTLSVDVGALQRGGVRIKELGDLASNIHGSLSGVTDRYGHELGGDGPVGNSFNASYYPAANAALEFLNGLKDLVGIHGSKTSGLGALFNDVNGAATNEAGRSGGRG